MERIVIRHLNGSKAHQNEEFSLKDFTELTVGRDLSSAIQYDLNQEDLVSRHHAKIIRDAQEAMEFCIIDVRSKNGTYVNHEKISGPTRLVPGAVVQLGVGGPEFQFDIEPRPQMAPPPTRVAQSQYAEVHAEVVPPPTRVEDTGTILSSPGISGKTRKPVGLTTVQRLIGDKLAGSEVRSRKSLLNSVAAVLGVITLVAGVFVYLHKTTKHDIYMARERIDIAHQGVQAMQHERNGLMSPTQITGAYGPASVHIAVSWKLVSARTGSQVYHQYIKLSMASNLLRHLSNIRCDVGGCGSAVCGSGGGARGSTSPPHCRACGNMAVQSLDGSSPT
jgi:serine protease Do